VGDAGLLVPAGNAEALAKGILRILREPQLAEELSLRARERIVNRFCWNHVAENMTNYYQDIIAQTPSC